jgi:hypothetical protein
MRVLEALGFGTRQRNEVAGYVLLSLMNVSAGEPWSAAQSPLRGITPIITFIRETFGVSYAPNTRETIRDEAVKYFVEAGLVLRNPDNPRRPTNSGNTVYQLEPSALTLLRLYGTPAWEGQLREYLLQREAIQQEIERSRSLARVAVHLPTGEVVTLSPGGQNPLIKAAIEDSVPDSFREEPWRILATRKINFFISMRRT